LRVCQFRHSGECCRYDDRISDATNRGHRFKTPRPASGTALASGIPRLTPGAFMGDGHTSPERERWDSVHPIPRLTPGACMGAGIQALSVSDGISVTCGATPHVASDPPASAGGLYGGSRPRRPRPHTSPERERWDRRDVWRNATCGIRSPGLRRGLLWGSGSRVNLRRRSSGRPHHSTVTLLARFRGLSTSQPRRTAMW